MKLYIANGSYVGTQAEAKRIDKSFEQVEVPTSKQELIDYLNDLVTPTINEVEGPIERMVTALETLQKPAEPQMPSFKHPAAVTTTDGLCAAISELEGVPLGHVALEVAARFTALAKRQELLG